MKTFDPCLRLAVLALVACGEPTVGIDVTLVSSSMPELDPYAPEQGLSKVRITIDGPEAFDDATIDLDRDGRGATFDGFPKDVEATIRVFGFNEFGGVIAFGRADEILTDDDKDITIPFRRNLAYVIHEAEPSQLRPEGHVYAIDMASRTFVSKIPLPGTAPIATGITARGGDSILVTYVDGGQAMIGILSADTHQFRTVRLERAHTHAIASPASKIAAAVGGNAVSFVDLDAGTSEVFPMAVAGAVKDLGISASGHRAVVALQSAALDLNLERRDVRQVAILPNPSGVAMNRQFAYLTSSSEGAVGQIDLRGNDTGVFPQGGFVKGVEFATFSEDFQSIMGLTINPDNGAARVIAFNVVTKEGFTLDEGNQALNRPMGIVADGAARRIFVPAAGTSSATAGITALETFADQLPVGSSTLYPLDPDDTYLSEGGVTLRQRWRPKGAAVIYGR
jgi:hypothetical protein